MYTQLLEYINKSKAQGVSIEQIKQNLLSSGWSEQDVQNAIASLNPVTNINSAVLNPSPVHTSSVLSSTQFKTEKKSGGILKFLLYFLILIILVGGGYYAYLNKSYFQDILNKFIPTISNNVAVTSNPTPVLPTSPVNPTNPAIKNSPKTNLELSVVQIPDTQNGFFDLDSITKDEVKFNLTEAQLSDYLQDKKFDLNNAKKIVDANKSAIDKFDKATEKDSFQIPIFSDPKSFNNVNLPLSSMSMWWSTSKVYLIKALLLAKQGQTQDALSVAFNSLKLGQNIQKSQGGLTIYILGSTIKDNGLKTIASILPYVKSKNLLNIYKLSLDQYKDSKVGLVNNLKAEYLVQSNIFDALSLIKTKEDIDSFAKNIRITDSAKVVLGYMINNPKAFNKDETMQYLNDYYGNLVKFAGGSCTDFIKQLELPDILPKNESEYKDTENIVGKVFASLVFTTTTTLQKSCDRDVLFNTTSQMFTQTKL